jgi:mono/diheme cytochrome c family protein
MNKNLERRIFDMKFLLSIFLILLLAIAFPCYAADLVRGRAVYGMNCAICHGEYGKGDGPRSAEFQPKPINFTDPQVMGNVTPQKFEKSVVEGLPNTTWHTFGHLLSPDAVLVVTEYVRSLIR